MDKNEKIIMAVNKELLFRGDYFQGFKPASEVDFYSRIIQSNIHMKRGEAEKSTTHKHPIAYLLVISPSFKVFAYQRSQKGNESRLHNKFSWGTGGHIDIEDMMKDGDPIQNSLLRELSEELTGAENPSLELIGYLNDDSDDVGKVHFGLLYIAKVKSEEIHFKDEEIKHGELKPINELEAICANPEYVVEGWSKIALEPLRNYILKARRKTMVEKHKDWPLLKRA